MPRTKNTFCNSSPTPESSRCSPGPARLFSPPFATHDDVTEASGCFQIHPGLLRWTKLGSQRQGLKRAGSPPPPGQQCPRPWTLGVKTLPARSRRGGAVVRGHIHGTESGWPDAR